jgi:hypothetical protein
LITKILKIYFSKDNFEKSKSSHILEENICKTYSTNKLLCKIGTKDLTKDLRKQEWSMICKYTV